MSYILEALKKAQAERQLSALPSIYTSSPQAVARSSGKPWWLALGALLALLLLLLLWLQPWRIAPVPPPALIQAPEVAAAPKAAPAPDVAQAPKVAQTPTASPPPKAAQAPNVAPVSKVAPAPKAVAQVRAEVRPSGAGSMPAPVIRQPVNVDRVPDDRAASGSAQATGTGTSSVTAATSAAAPASVPIQAAEEVVPALRALPESIQRQIPALVLGGYIYSKNPQDRLLLIDKTLRREGEQVAPGLILETLRRTSAIFNYNGVRYQMAY